jgi:hypothetical protein
MNWYRVTTKGYVTKYDVTKTQTRYVYSNCSWDRDALERALRDVAEEGIAEFRITEFRTTPEPVEDSYRRSAVDIDARLGI